MSNTLTSRINEMQKQLNQLKQAASDEASGKAIKQGFAEIRADKQRARDKGAKVFAAYDALKEAEKFKPLTDNGFIRTAKIEGAFVFGKRGSNLMVHVIDNSFFVKNGLSAKAEIVKAKTSFNQIGQFLDSIKPGATHSFKGVK